MLIVVSYNGNTRAEMGPNQEGEHGMDVIARESLYLTGSEPRRQLLWICDPIMRQAFVHRIILKVENRSRMRKTGRRNEIATISTRG